MPSRLFAETAHDIASEILRKPEAQKRIEALQDSYDQQSTVPVADVVRQLNYMGKAELSDIVYKADGSINWQETPIHVRRAIKEVRIERTDTKDGPRFKTKVRLYKKSKNLVNLLKRLDPVSTEPPSLEVLLSRLPPAVASKLRQMLAEPDPIERERPR